MRPPTSTSATSWAIWASPTTGSILASPDIILRPTAVGSPQAAFGAGSGTENDATLGATAEIGQDNFVYVRVLNQGGSPATSVKATVYWSPVATLVTPDYGRSWARPTIPSVPIGEQLTVSSGIVWHQAQIPAAGHYCFVGLIGNAADPAPGPADFGLEQFLSLHSREQQRNVAELQRR